MKIKRIVSLLLVLVLAVSAIAVLGSCKKEEEKKTDNIITVQIGPNPKLSIRHLTVQSMAAICSSLCLRHCL